MNITKRILSVLMVAVMVFTVAPMGSFSDFDWLGFEVGAEEGGVEYFELSVGSADQNTFTHEGGRKFLKFVPEESAMYSFSLYSGSGYSVSEKISLYDECMVMQSYNLGKSSGIEKNLYKGQIYYVCLNATAGMYKVRVSKKYSVNDAIQINPGEKITVGYTTSQQVYFKPTISGEYTFFTEEGGHVNCSLYDNPSGLLAYEFTNKDNVPFSMTYYFKEGTKYRFNISNGEEKTFIMSEVSSNCEHSNLTVYDEVAPSCENLGYTSGEYCEDCQKWINGHKMIREKHTDEDFNKICDVCLTENFKNIIDDGFSGENVTWTLYDNGELVISGQGEMYDYEGDTYGNNQYPEYMFYDDMIEEIIFESGVENVGANTFAYLEKLEKVTLSESVLEIGQYAFGSCRNLTEINFPEKLHKIGSEAFWWCGKLEKVNLPDGLKSIGDEAFYSCSNLKQIEIPGSVYTIGGSAFESCDRLEKVVLNDGLVEISNRAFLDCKSLKNLTIPKTVEFINPYFLGVYDSLEEIIVDEDNEYYYNDDKGAVYAAEYNSLLWYPHHSETASYDVAEGTREIEEYAFLNAANVEELSLPDSLKSLSESQFAYCSSLKSINLPESISVLPYATFRDCKALENAKLNNGIKEIKSYAFSGCTALETLVIPSSVTTIEKIFGYPRNGSEFPEKIVILSKNCSIDSGLLSFNEGVLFTTIYGFNGSTAQEYAENNGIDFVAIDKSGIENISFESLPAKSEYDINDMFDPYGIGIRVNYKDGNSYVLSDVFTYSGFDSSEIGKCTVTASYEGFETTFEVEITENARIEIFEERSYEATRLEMQPQKSKAVKFIPKFDGVYSFQFNNFGENATVSVFDLEMNPVSCDVYWYGAYSTLKAGETYYYFMTADTVTGYENCYILCSENLCSHEETVTIPQIDPTCYETGCTESVKCLKCNDWVSGHFMLLQRHIDENEDNICDLCNNVCISRINTEGIHSLPGKANEYVRYIEFIPEVTGMYKVSPFSSGNVRMHDENLNRIYFDDLDDFDNTYRPAVDTFMIKGHKYYFSIDSKNYGINSDGKCGIYKIEFECTQPAYEIEYNQQKNAEFNSVSSLCFEYECNESGKYAFTTNFVRGSDDYALSVYDSDFNNLEAIENRDLSYGKKDTVYNFVSGETYYFTANFTDGYSRTGTFDVTLIDYCEHAETEYVGYMSPSCTEEGYDAGRRCVECGFWVSGHDSYKATGHIDDDSDGICDRCEYPLSDIEVNSRITVFVEENNDIYLSFIAPETSDYTFGSFSENDVCLYLYDEDKNLIISNVSDDGNIVDVSVTYELEKGKAYYWALKFEDITLSGDVDIEITCACLHENMIITGGIEATCIEDGLSKGERCPDCERVFSVSKVISATGHRFFIMSAVEPTCTEDGYTEYKDCRLCGEVFSERKVIPATGHCDGDDNGFCDICFDSIERTDTTENEETTAPTEETTEGKETTTKPTTTEKEEPITKPTTTQKEEPTTKAPATTAPLTTKAPSTTKAPTTTEKQEKPAKAKKPAKVKVKKPTSKKKKQVTVTWNKVKNVNGYQIAYSTSKKFTKKTTKTKLIKKAKTTKTSLKKLKSGKKYFIKVRAYKTVNKKKLYGAYSKVMTVKVK